MSKTNLSDAVASRQRRENKDRDRARAAATGESADEPEKRLNVDVPESLHERFKDRCREQGRSMRYVMSRFAEHFAETGELPPV